MKTNGSLSLAGSHIYIAGFGRWASSAFVGRLEIGTGLTIQTNIKFRPIAGKQQATVDRVVS
jgi:hypothetical protein